MSDKFQTIWRQIREQAARDTKKTVALAGLFLILAGVVTWRAVGSSELPSQAAAAPASARVPLLSSSAEHGLRPRSEALLESSDTPPLVHPIETPKRRNADTGESPNVEIRNPKSEIPIDDVQSTSVQSEIRNPKSEIPRVLARDLFTTDAWPQFPIAWAPEVEEASAKDKSKKNGDGDFLSGLLKSIAQRREAARRGQELLAVEIKTLTLEATITGSSPCAYISGRLVRLDEEIQGFSVVAIDDRRVMLEKSGQVCTLRMK